MAKAPKRAGSGSRKTSGPKKSKPRATQRAASTRPARSGSKAGYNVICSECYSEFGLTSTEPAAKISCPECMHMGEVSTSDVMGQIALAKGAEKGWLIKALIPTALMIIAGFAYLFMIRAKGQEGELIAALGDGLNYGMLGGIAILAIIAIALASKFESNRYDVYF